MKLETTQRKIAQRLLPVVVAISLLTAGYVAAEERVVKIAGYGAETGVLPGFDTGAAGSCVCVSWRALGGRCCSL